MRNLQKIAGIAALCEALIYIVVMVFYGAVWHFPSDADSAQKLAFLAQNQTILSIINLLGYVGFGILLALLVLAVHERLKTKSPTISMLACVFGVVWVGLVIASGMLANIGLATTIKLFTKGSEHAWAVWLSANTVVEGLGGGNEIVGGLWVLLLSSAALKSQALSRPLSYLGLFLGLLGIVTVYPAAVLTDIFGLAQILWFAWLGIYLMRHSESEHSSVHHDH